MAIILNGTTGITTPDIDSIAGFDGEDLTGDVAAARITGALNASGSAPIFACRAWVNFNGTGTVAIRAAGNVSSITDNGTGDYTVNFTTALTDGNYAFQGFIRSDLSTPNSVHALTAGNGATKTTSVFRVLSRYANSYADGLVDSSEVNISVFR